MPEIPYKFTGPLDPVRNKQVCVPREHVVQEFSGLLKESPDYWAVFGARQIGKTTLLRQIARTFPQPHYLTLNYEMPPESKKEFYRELVEEFLREIPGQSPCRFDIKQGRTPELAFLEFLETFKPEDDSRKIVFLIEEVERIPSVNNFLHAWRTVFHDRYRKKGLNRYAVVIAGGVNLIRLTVGANSPFNIAGNCILKDFSPEESLGLIRAPMMGLGITLEADVEQTLLRELEGHPQMLQQTCHFLAKTALGKEKRLVSNNDVNAALDNLLKECPNLDLLKIELESDEAGRSLLQDILRGKKKIFYVYKDYAIKGAGPIKETEDSSCTIRNNVFRRFLEDTLGDTPGENSTPARGPSPSAAVKPAEPALSTYDIFFIYNPGIQSFARDVAAGLAGLGINAFAEEWRIPPNCVITEYIDNIAPLIKSAVVFVGGDGTGPWETETHRLLITGVVKRRIPVTLVVAPGLEGKLALPSYLQGFPQVYFDGVPGNESAFAALREQIAGNTGKAVS